LYNSTVSSMTNSSRFENGNQPPDVAAVEQQSEVTLNWLSMINRRNEALSNLQSILRNNSTDDQTLSQETFCHLFSQTVKSIS